MFLAGEMSSERGVKIFRAGSSSALTTWAPASFVQTRGDVTGRVIITHSV